MRAGGELQGPVGYDERWLALALLSLAVVALYYLTVSWWGRARDRPLSPQPTRPPRPARRRFLAQLDDIESAVTAGQITAREGHQRISRTVRGFVADATGLPARSMTLADLERKGPERLAVVVALVYPPEFGPGEELAREVFSTAVGQARELVTSWT